MRDGSRRNRGKREGGGREASSPGSDEDDVD
jgi:hypothetical protein